MDNQPIPLLDDEGRSAPPTSVDSSESTRSLPAKRTILDLFFTVARDPSPSLSERTAMALGCESWTYADLDVVSAGLALELLEKLNAREATSQETSHIDSGEPKEVDNNSATGLDGAPAIRDAIGNASDVQGVDDSTVTNNTQLVLAVVSPNHPYLFATFLAVWKLGGIIAPLDPHTPDALLKSMLENVKPHFIMFEQEDTRIAKLAQTLQIPSLHDTLTFKSGLTTITSLIRRFLDITPGALDHALQHGPTSVDRTQNRSGNSRPGVPIQIRAPSPDDIAAYVHTSSATYIGNIKCVPLRHFTLVQGAVADAHTVNKTFVGRPSTTVTAQSGHHDDLLGLQLVHCGWSPWTHMLGLERDVLMLFATGGCYRFAVPPVGYAVVEDDDLEGVLSEENSVTGTSSVPISGNKSSDIPSALLDTIVRYPVDIIIGVPWIYESIRGRIESEPDARQKAAMVERLRKLKHVSAGGAFMGEDLRAWVTGLGLPLSLDMGMTELSGPLFHGNANGFRGWTMADCKINDAEIEVIHREGFAQDEGELVVTSGCIATCYLGLRSNSIVTLPDGRTKLFTGDIYSKSAEGFFNWKGRIDDFIQLVSGEILDPRPIESRLNACPSIAQCAITGNGFLSTTSDNIWAIIKPSGGIYTRKHESDIARVLRGVNGELAPPFRIPWGRVLVLGEDEEIPMSKKKAVFRKKLEGLFKKRMDERVGKGTPTNKATMAPAPPPPPQPVEATNANSDVEKQSDVLLRIGEVISKVLGLEKSILVERRDTPFAELGMDSAMAVQIVKELNSLYRTDLPPNACHTFVDLRELSNEILKRIGVSKDALSSSGLSQSPHPPQAPEGETVVIVGQAMRLPGNVNSPDSYWQTICSPELSDKVITPIPSDRWDHASYYRSPASVASAPLVPGDITFDKAGFVDVMNYDPTFFGITSAEAYYVAPNGRLVLETAWEALENANIPHESLKGSNAGVFVGTGVGEGYDLLLYQDKGSQAYSRYFGTGVANSMICGRLSYLLDIHGPSMVIDTACSAGLVALDHGVKHIASGKGEVSIVCAANTNIAPGPFGFLSAQKMSSVNARCATFTDKADGYVPAEGAVTFILKSKSAAIRDGDKILATVRSADVQHGGRSQGVSAPNVNGQISLHRSLLRAAGLSPADIDFVETHGSGTPLGDLIEIQGISEVYKGGHRDSPLILTASKTCFGHTETAAGLVGISSVLNSFRHGAVPPIKHLTSDNLNPAINQQTSPFVFPVKVEPLPAKGGAGPYRALVLANGFAGTLAGTILESQHSPSSPSDFEEDSGPFLFVISAKTSNALHAYIRNYLTFCRSASPASLKAICYTTCLGRSHYQYRFSAVVRDLDELVSTLKEAVSSYAPDKLPAARGQNILFAFPGQGSQYYGMAAHLVSSFKTFSDLLQPLAIQAEELSSFPVYALLTGNATGSESLIDDGRVLQVCIFVYQYAVATWLQKMGIHPVGVLGHSLGEFAATAVAGAFKFADLLPLVVKRAELIHTHAAPGGMVIVQASKDRISTLLEETGTGDRLSIAVYNGPESHVLSGDSSLLVPFLERCRVLGIRAARLKVDQAFHSDSISGALPPFREWIQQQFPNANPLTVPMFSTVDGTRFDAGHILRPDYWPQHARNPVKLFHSVEGLASDARVSTVLDIGPQPFVTTAIEALGLDSAQALLPTTGKRGTDQAARFLTAISTLFNQGVRIDFSGLLGPKEANLTTSLPTYPYQRHRHYPSFIPSRNAHATPRGSPSLSAGTSPTLPFPIDEGLCKVLQDHKINGQVIAPGASLVDFFAKLSPHLALTRIHFTSPLSINSPEDKVVADIKSDGTFTLSPTSSTPVAQGNFSTTRIPHELKTYLPSDPSLSFDKKAVYANFGGVQFGPLFQSIVKLRQWEDRADGLISVEPTGVESHDRLRALDACLHMFGALDIQPTRNMRGDPGCFLPTSLENFQFHSTKVPQRFICRYHLPVQTSRQSRVISTAFDIITPEGELIATCEKYTVAWLYASVLLQNPAQQTPATASKDVQDCWWNYDWKPAPISATASSNQLQLDSVQVASFGNTSPVYSFLVTRCKSLSKFDPLGSDVTYHPATGALLVIDMTQCHDEPGSSRFQSSYRSLFQLLKTIVAAPIRLAGIILVTSTPKRNGSDAFTHPSASSLAKAMVQVYGNETGTQDTIRSVELPDPSELSQGELDDILTSELLERQIGEWEPSISYRRLDSESSRYTRCVHRLNAIPAVLSSSLHLRGVAVVTGLGSIGGALAPALLSAGASKVVFLGRRSADSTEIMDSLKNLGAGARDKCAYLQTDVLDGNALQAALAKLQSESHPEGGISSIIHTAAVVSDATISNTSPDNLERVLAPKITGAWNLHCASEALGLNLRAFVLLSSISVPLGNPGQVAYTAGNAFMDELARYRQSRGLCATSLQLGAWESVLAANIRGALHATLVVPVDNATGIPRIMEAIASSDPSTPKNAVQLIARFNLRIMAESTGYGSNPLFQSVLQNAPRTHQSNSLAEPQLELTKEFVTITFVDIVKNVLEMTSSDNLELEQSLTSSGVDSIAFAEIRAGVKKLLNKELPISMLQDTYTIQGIINKLAEKPGPTRKAGGPYN